MLANLAEREVGVIAECTDRAVPYIGRTREADG